MPVDRGRARVIIGARRICCKVLSRLAQRPGRGSLVAVFDRSFLIETEGPFLIHVGRLSAPLTPRSLLVGEDDFLRIYSMLSPKQAVWISSNGIAWLDLPLGITIDRAEKISLRTRFEGGWPLENEGLNNVAECLSQAGKIHADRENISPLRGYFQTRFQFLQASSVDLIRPPDFPDKDPEGANPYKEFLWPRIDGFLNSLKRESWEEVQRTLPEIIGSGPGLTPSGDDFLAGFLSAGAVMGRSSLEAKSLLDRLGEIILSQAKGRTTEVSMAMLEDAVEGEISEPFLNLLTSACGGDREAIPGAVKKILAFGGSSGEDQLNGLCVGLIFFQRLVSCGQRLHPKTS